MIPDLQSKNLISQVPIHSRTLQYLAAHCKSLQRIRHSFCPDDIVHEAGIQISLKRSHSEQHDIFVFLGQGVSQNSMTSSGNQIIKNPQIIIENKKIATKLKQL